MVEILSVLSGLLAMYFMYIAMKIEDKNFVLRRKHLILTPAAFLFGELLLIVGLIIMMMTVLTNDVFWGKLNEPLFKRKDNEK